MPFDLTLLNLSLRNKIEQEKNVVFIINDKDLEYMFRIFCSYDSRVVHVYTGVGAASSSQPAIKSNEK